MPNERDIGSCIRFHRKQAGLSQAGLAQLAGVGKTVVYDIEHGKQSVRLNTLLKLMSVLNIRLQLESPLMTHFEEDRDA